MKLFIKILVSLLLLYVLTFTISLVYINQYTVGYLAFRVLILTLIVCGVIALMYPIALLLEKLWNW